MEFPKVRGGGGVEMFMPSRGRVCIFLESRDLYNQCYSAWSLEKLKNCGFPCRF